MAVDFEVVEDNIEKITKMSDEAIEKALLEIGAQAERNAKKEISAVVYDTPISPSGYRRTGLLRNSITFALDGKPAQIGQYKADVGGKTGRYEGTAPEEGAGKRAVFVGTNVEYASHVEVGTSRMKPRPYLKPAVQGHQEEYKAIIKRNMENA